MAYIVTISHIGATSEKISDVNDISFSGDHMILCLTDLKTRLVRKLETMQDYKIVEQPVKRTQASLKKK